MVRGAVVDAVSAEPLPGATVVLVPSDPVLGTVADSLGAFSFTDVPIGHYSLRVEYVGYEPMVVPEVWARSGKDAVQRVELSPSAVALEVFTVSALAREDPQTLGVRTMTVEQSLRYPAMFFDPARVAASTAGVNTANDQANHMSIRGNSPNANSWLLEGAEMVNPNHTANAGTANDLPTLSGGGVIMLSSQMLGPSRLLTGSLPVDRSNAVGGIMDMELRNGSSAGQEWTAQAGLLGIDLATEGPFRAGGRSSYVVNYRYSTLGLLGAMGVELGDEAITFQDLSFTVSLPFAKAAEVKLFGMGGTSTNDFLTSTDTLDWEDDKDGSDIAYSSRTGAIGSSLRLPVGRSGTVRATALLSGTEQERELIRYRTDLSESGRRTDDLAETKLSLVAGYDGKAGTRWRYSLGGSALARELNTLFGRQVDTWLVRGYGNARFGLTEHITLGAGLGVAQDTRSNTTVLEPRASVNWRWKTSSVAFSYGQRSQLRWYQIINTDLGSQGAINEDLGMTRSEDFVLGYDRKLNERLSLHAEAYVQLLSNVLVETNMLGSQVLGNLVNAWDDLSFFTVRNSGVATNQGIELTVNHTLATGYFYTANATVYDSRYELANGESKDTRWNGNYGGNLMGGKEWEKNKGDRIRTWGVSARMNYRGGLRYTPYLSARRGFVSLGEPYSAQFDPFFRLDLRVYLKTDRKGRTGMWALDLQNATNAENAAYVYYDQRMQEVVTKYQLGLIPNLSYRIEF